MPSFGNLPPYNKPLPDSDIAHLWEEVKSKATEMIDPSLVISSELSRQPDIFPTQGSIKTMPSWTSKDVNLDEYLEIKSIIGNPQFSTMPDKEHETSPYTSGDRFYYMFVNHLLHRRFTALNGLRAKTQISSDSTQQGNVDVAAQPEILRVFDFISTCTRGGSGEPEKEIFTLEIENTLYNKGWPLFAIMSIPSVLMGKQRCGPSFLYLLLFRNRASSTALAKWKSDAQEEFTNQLRLSRNGFSDQERRNMVSRLRHFCYLVEGSKLVIWEMKVEVKPPETLNPTTSRVSSGSTTSENEQIPSSSSTSPRVGLPEKLPTRPTPPGQTFHLPCDLPCKSREVYSFDLDRETDRRQFYDTNKAIMKWAQAKHAPEYVQSFYRLGNRVKNGTEMQLCWKNIVFGQYDEVLVEDKVLVK